MHKIQVLQEALSLLEMHLASSHLVYLSFFYGFIASFDNGRIAHELHPAHVGQAAINPVLE